LDKKIKKYWGEKEYLEEELIKKFILWKKSLKAQEESFNQKLNEIKNKILDVERIITDIYESSTKLKSEIDSSNDKIKNLNLKINQTRNTIDDLKDKHKASFVELQNLIVEHLQYLIEEIKEDEDKDAIWYCFSSMLRAYEIDFPQFPLKKTIIKEAYNFLTMLISSCLWAFIILLKAFLKNFKQYSGSCLIER